MDIVVTARNCEVSDRFRDHVAEKLHRLEKHDHRLMRVHVEVDCEPNPRQHKDAVHVELTAYSKGPVIRAEACAADKMAALDMALDKMAPRCVAPTIGAGSTADATRPSPSLLRSPTSNPPR